MFIRTTWGWKGCVHIRHFFWNEVERVYVHHWKYPCAPVRLWVWWWWVKRCRKGTFPPFLYLMFHTIYIHLSNLHTTSIQLFLNTYIFHLSAFCQKSPSCEYYGTCAFICHVLLLLNLGEKGGDDDSSSIVHGVLNKNVLAYTFKFLNNKVTPSQH